MNDCKFRRIGFRQTRHIGQKEDGVFRPARRLTVLQKLLIHLETVILCFRLRSRNSPTIHALDTVAAHPLILRNGVGWKLSNL